MRKLSKHERELKKIMKPKDSNNYRRFHGLPMRRMAYMNGKRRKVWHYGIFG